MATLKYFWDFRTLSAGDLSANTVVTDSIGSKTATIKCETAVAVKANGNGVIFNNEPWGETHQRVELNTLSLDAEFSLEFVFKGNFNSWTREQREHADNHAVMNYVKFKVDEDDASTPTAPDIGIRREHRNLGNGVHYDSKWLKEETSNTNKTLLKYTDETFSHILISYGSSSSALYLDGVEMYTDGPGMSGAVDYTYNILGGESTKGTLAYLKIYTGTHTSSEATGVYNTYNGAPGIDIRLEIIPDTIIPQPKLIYDYDFRPLRSLSHLASISGQEVQSELAGVLSTAKIQGCEANDEGLEFKNYMWGADGGDDSGRGDMTPPVAYFDGVILPDMTISGHMSIEYVWRWEQEGTVNYESQKPHTHATLFTFDHSSSPELKAASQSPNTILLRKSYSATHNIDGVSTAGDRLLYKYGWNDIFEDDVDTAGGEQDEFHHHVVTFSYTDGMKAYVDGELILENEWVSLPTDGTWDKNYIGRSLDLHATNWKEQGGSVIGTLQYMKLYDRDFAEIDVSGLYGAYLNPDIEEKLSQAQQLKDIEALGISGTEVAGLSWTPPPAVGEDAGGLSISGFFTCSTASTAKIEAMVNTLGKAFDEKGEKGGNLIKGRASLMKNIFNYNSNMTVFTMPKKKLGLDDYFLNIVENAVVVKSSTVFKYSRLSAVDGLYMNFEHNSLGLIQLTDDVTLRIKRKDVPISGATEAPFVESRHYLYINDTYSNDWGDVSTSARGHGHDISGTVIYQKYAHRHIGDAAETPLGASGNGTETFTQLSKIKYLLTNDRVKIEIEGQSAPYYFIIGSVSDTADVPWSDAVLAVKGTANASLTTTNTLLDGLTLSTADNTEIKKSSEELIKAVESLTTPIPSYFSAADGSDPTSGKSQHTRRPVLASHESHLKKIRDHYVPGNVSTAAQATQKKVALIDQKTALDMILVSSNGNGNLESIVLAAENIITTESYLTSTEFVIPVANKTVVDPTDTSLTASNVYATLSNDNDYIIRTYRANISPTSAQFSVKILRTDVGSEERYGITLTDITWDQLNTVTNSNISSRFNCLNGEGYLLAGDQLTFYGVTDKPYIIIGSGEFGFRGETICFLGRAEVMTDQGLVAFNKLTTEHTISNKVIKKVVNVLNAEVVMVFIKKDAFGLNVPNQDMYISRHHGIIINGHLVRARDLVNGSTVQSLLHERSQIYNVLLDTHEVIYVNNMPCESLNPSDPGVKKFL